MDKPKFLLKIIKRKRLIKRCYILCQCIYPFLLLADVILYFTQKDNLNVGLYASILVVAIILIIVSFILYFEKKFYREIIDDLVNMN